MRRSFFALLVVSGLLAQTAKLSVEEIAGKYVEAMGGSAFAGIHSLRIEGRMRFGLGEFTPFTVVASRPNRFRMELTVGPDHVTQAFDGKTGWQSVAGEHPQAPTPLTGKSLSHIKDQAANAIGGPLVDRDRRHNRIELAGRETVYGVDCYRIKVTLGTGNIMAIFIDSANYREVQEELVAVVNGKPMTIEQSVSQYRKFGPILVGCLFVTREKGGEDSQRMEIDNVEINPTLDESLFRFAGGSREIRRATPPATSEPPHH